MDISLMVSQLKNEIAPLEKSIADKKQEIKTLRLRIGALEMEMQKETDTYEAMKMALDALEMIPGDRIQTEVKPEPVLVAKPLHVEIYTNTRKAKKVGKFDPQGVKIGEYSSVNQCAKDFGWGNGSMKKYIETNSKDKQIRLRGYYLEYLAV
jgi:hypothetical protein